MSLHPGVCGLQPYACALPPDRSW